MIGFGLKIPCEVADKHGGIKKFCADFYQHMARFLPEAPAGGEEGALAPSIQRHWLIGYDTKFCTKPHYHYHFEGTFAGLSKKTVQNHKNKFAVKHPEMKFYIFDPDSRGDFGGMQCYDIYKWLAYAGKEQIISWSQTLDENILQIRIKESLMKKQKEYEDQLKQLEQKELKDNLWECIIQHVRQNSARLFGRHFSEISPIQFRQLVIDYYRGQEDKKVIRRQDLIYWQNKYFMYHSEYTLEELDRLIMGPLG